MRKIALIYSPLTGKTEQVAQRFKEMLPEFEVDLIPAMIADRDLLNSYDRIVLGLMADNTGNYEFNLLSNPWRQFQQQLNSISLEGKKSAVFYLFNQKDMDFHLEDELAKIRDVLLSRGAQMVGHFSPDPHSAHAFAGLPLDEENEPHLTDSRLQHWANILRHDFTA